VIFFAISLSLSCSRPAGPRIKCPGFDGRRSLVVQAAPKREPPTDVSQFLGRRRPYTKLVGIGRVPDEMAPDTDTALFGSALAMPRARA